MLRYKMPLVRQTTAVGLGPNARRKARARTKAAYSKRGAYKPRNKRQFKNARRPFVEGKRRELADCVADFWVIDKPDPGNFPNGVRNPMLLDTTAGQESFALSYIGNDDAFTTFHPTSFIQMAHGLDDHHMIGRSVYVKYIKTKIQLQWPRIAPSYPTSVYLVHGWLKTPMNLTEKTTPKASECNFTNITTFINDRVQRFFDEKTDKLQFIPKSANNDVKILGYRKCSPNLNAQTTIPLSVVGNPVDGTQMVGGIPNTNMSCTWAVNRKIHYERGAATGSSGQSYAAHSYFPNVGWLPFCVVYNPDFASYETAVAPNKPENAAIRVLVNNCTWYSDS